MKIKFTDLSDIYMLDLKTWIWKKLETDPKTIPPPRNKHGFVNFCINQFRLGVNVSPMSKLVNYRKHFYLVSGHMRVR